MSEPRPVEVRDPRSGLRMSATLATVFTLLGHTVLDFEQSTAQLLVALLTGYTTAILFESVDAASNGRKPGFAGGGPLRFVDWMLSAHMTSITLSFLLYTQEQLWPMALAVALAIGSKYLLRVRIDGRLRHFMNPSNFGASIVLIFLPWNSAIPWEYTVRTQGWQDWVFPFFILLLGLRLNLLYTKRLPLIGAWIAGFLVQGALRSWLTDTPLLGEWAALTNIVAVLFTLYMITDPQTSPSRPERQVAFGLAIAAAYGVLLTAHVQFTLFMSTLLVCALRGLWIVAEQHRAARARVSLG